MKLFLGADKRSKNININIMFSFLFKGLILLISFILVPLTIKYLNPVRYGIWITVSSIISWMTLFDVGLGNGLRNKFAESIALGNEHLARIYVSTTYVLLTLIVLAIYIPFISINSIIDWTKILNTPAYMKFELKELFFIVFSFFSIQFILKILTTILIAWQKPAYSDFINFLTNLVSLAVVYILTIYTSGSLLRLAAAYSGAPVIVLIILSIYIYTGKLKKFKPSFKYVDFKYARNLYSLGIRFFIIQLTCVIIYSTNSLIISNVLGPAAVTPYNIAYKYFSIITVAYFIIMTPMWSSSTDAYTRKDIQWIEKSNRKNKFIWKILSVIAIGMIFAASYVYKIWIAGSVTIPFKLTFIMGMYVIANTFLVPYTFFINGTGKITLQLIVSIAAAIINIPISIFLARFMNLGSSGVVLGSIISTIPNMILLPVQYKKIIIGNMKGIWAK
ncbi:MAG: MATE family efflux transporter [Ignavibacteriaceae bacterium]|nr:MATE family efflux transporter [Ignavibacteriaceae bacterium]